MPTSSLLQENEERCQGVERQCLAALRRDNGIECNDPEAERKRTAQKKRKKAANQPVPEHKEKKKVRTFRYDDSDDEGEDSK